MKKIILTGGGTAGHVTPNIALMPRLRELGYEISYIGSYKGIEKELIEKEGIPYYAISSGKLRRYFDLKNFTDPFRINHGVLQARRLIRRLKPDIIFSKGGFVSVPVVLAASREKVPVIIHESDMTPGLANKLSFPFASKVCCNFPETVKYLPKDKAVLSGSPIRTQLLSGDPQRGKEFCSFDGSLPVLLIIGGSLGSVSVNNAVRRNLPALLSDFQIVHLCGKGNLDPSLEGTKGYVQFEFIREELPDLFAMADVVISRAGANAICELLALRKPSLLIPLPASASRGDQILNARSFAKQGYSEMLEEETLTDEKLLKTVHKLYTEKEKYVAAMNKGQAQDAISIITGLIEEAVNKS